VYARYVVGVDGSSPSRAALSWAAGRAETDGVPLVIAHVEEPEGGMMGGDFARTEMRSGSDLLTQLASSLHGHGTDVSTTLLSGFVPWSLAEATRPDDLLVIGTHKTGFLHGRVLGSRSVQIAASARCTVAVIPDTDLRRRTGVVVGVRPGETPDVIEAAAAEASRHGQQLSVIRSISPHTEKEPSPAIQAVQAAHPGLSIRTKETRRSPAEALLDAGRDKALLVIGPGVGTGTGSPIGSVLHDVLLNLTAPVLVVRDPRQGLG